MRPSVRSPVLACPACGARFEVESARSACTCGAWLEVEHALDRSLLAAIDERAQPGHAGDARDLAWDDHHAWALRRARRSGVWRFREWVDPALPERDIVSLDEGHTPLFDAPAAARWAGLDALLVKHEGHNPSGSFKDRGMTVAVSRARHAGAVRLGCASTGNTAASLAAYAARAGLPCVVLAPQAGTSLAKLSQSLASGACVRLVRGDFDRVLELARALAERGALRLVNSVDPFRLEGQKTAVFEVLSELGWNAPDWIALPAGNLGNTAAFGKALRELAQAGVLARTPRLLAVQARGAAPFAASFERGFDALRPLRAETVASAIRIGAPASYERAVRAIRATNGAVLSVEDGDLLAAKAELDRGGTACEPASAASLAGVRAAVSRGLVRRDERVVCVLTAHALKDPESTWRWHAGELEPATAGRRNAPQVLDADVEALERSLAAP